MSENKILAVNSNCYHGFTIEEAIDGIAKAGFKYIELTATKGWTEHVMPYHSFSYLMSVKERCEEKGIIPIALSGHCNLMDDDRINDFIENIKLANFFGCRYVVSSVGEAHLEDKVDSAEDRAIENIRKLIPLLEGYDLKLVLEVHGEHGTGKKIQELIKRINSKRVAINYDTANAVFYGGVQDNQDLKECIADVDFIHLKDKAGEKKEWNFPAVGKGDLNFNEIKEIVEGSSKDIPLSIEIEFTPEGVKDVAEIDKAVKDSFDYLKKIGWRIL